MSDQTAHRSTIGLITGAVLLAGAFACAAAALIMQGGRWSARLDIANHFAPIIVAGCVVAVAACAGGRRLPAGRWSLGLAILALLVAAQVMVPEVWATATAKQEKPQGRVLKLVQFNVWADNQATQETLAWIKAENPDILTVEEAADGAWPLNRALRKLYPHWASCDTPRPCAVMVYSRLPMTRRGRRSNPPAAWASYLYEGREITVLATHQFWPYPVGLQQQQTRRLADFITGLPQDHLIVAGDFNSTPWSFALRRQDEAFGLERRTHMLASFPARAFKGHRIRSEGDPLTRAAARLSRRSLPAPFPVLPIDHVYAGEGWRTVSVRRGPRLGSDHYPVVVQLAPR